MNHRDRSRARAGPESRTSAATRSAQTQDRGGKGEDDCAGRHRPMSYSGLACRLAPKGSATSRRLSMMSLRENTMSGDAPPEVVFSRNNIAALAAPGSARLADHSRGPRRSRLLIQRGIRRGPAGPTKAVTVVSFSAPEAGRAASIGPARGAGRSAITSGSGPVVVAQQDVSKVVPVLGLVPSDRGGCLRHQEAPKPGPLIRTSRRIAPSLARSVCSWTSRAAYLAPRRLTAPSW